MAIVVTPLLSVSRRSPFTSRGVAATSNAASVPARWPPSSCARSRRPQKSADPFRHHPENSHVCCHGASMSAIAICADLPPTAQSLKFARLTSQVVLRLQGAPWVSSFRSKTRKENHSWPRQSSGAHPARPRTDQSAYSSTHRFGCDHHSRGGQSSDFGGRQAVAPDAGARDRRDVRL